MQSGGFPIDLILFGMIAAFLVLRLRSILGRRQGFERNAPPPARVRPVAAGPVVDAPAEVPGAAPRRLPDAASAAEKALVRMQSLDRNFQAARFLDGAEQAFGLIVKAFAAGDRATLAPLLTVETLSAFESAIAAREANGETQRTEIKQIRAATIEQAALTGTLAELAVRFVSDQISLTLGKDGQPLTGTDAVTEIVDMWSFVRDLSLPDPAWRLAAARSA